MWKIFKYPAGYEKGKLYYFGPKGKVVRTGWVEDNTYKGFWVWVIVDTEDKNYEKIFVQEKEQKDISKEFCSSWYDLGVIEEQIIKTYEDYEPVGIVVENGFIKFGVNFGNITNKELDEFKIVGYKTGQVIPYHPQNLFYLGCAPLIIKDEICIYFFQVAH